MSNLLDIIKSGKVLLCDGAVGTMLMKKGVKPGGCMEILNIEKPEIVEEIASDYFNAGADIVLTNTLGGTPLKLAQYGLDDKTDVINSSAVKIVRRVSEVNCFVVASIGSTGRILKPYGDISPEEVFESFKKQLEILHSEGIDGICVETMTDLEEAKLAVSASKEIAPEIPVMATMTFDATERGFFTIMGNNIEASIAGLKEAGADIIGSNCGNGIENMVKIAKEFTNLTDMPVIIQSNAGLPKSVDGNLVFSETPEFMSEHCQYLLDAGIKIIGGCCGTTPEHISAFRKLIDNFNCNN